MTAIKRRCTSCGKSIEGEPKELLEAGWRWTSRKKGGRDKKIVGCPQHRDVIEAELREAGRA